MTAMRTVFYVKREKDNIARLPLFKCLFVTDNRLVLFLKLYS